MSLTLTHLNLVGHPLSIYSVLLSLTQLMHTLLGSEARTVRSQHCQLVAKPARLFTTLILVGNLSSETSDECGVHGTLGQAQRWTIKEGTMPVFFFVSHAISILVIFLKSTVATFAYS